MQSPDEAHCWDGCGGGCGPRLGAEGRLLQGDDHWLGAGHLRGCGKRGCGKRGCGKRGCGKRGVVRGRGKRGCGKRGCGKRGVVRGAW